MANDKRRRAASYMAEALQVALADGLELAITMATDMAEQIEQRRLPDLGGAEQLRLFAEGVAHAVNRALAEAAERRRNE